MPTSSFIEARRRGKVGQEIVKAKLVSKGFNVNLVKDGYFKDWDGIAAKGNIRFTLEIKHDYKARETGNLAVEVDSLAHSKASMLFYVVEEYGATKSYVMPLQDCLRFAQNWHTSKNGGEFNKKLALIPLPTFKQLPFVKEF
jgi:hypothetical protein